MQTRMMITRLTHDQHEVSIAPVVALDAADMQHHGALHHAVNPLVE